MRLFASMLLVLGLVLMPVAMTGHAASASEPAAASPCPDHHEPASPDAPAHKGMVHCMMCAALPQPDLSVAQQVVMLTRTDGAVAPPQLHGVTPTVSDPPPKIA